MIAWLSAFLFTQLVEIPIYARALAPRPLMARLAIAFGASLLTHPLVWWGVLHFTTSEETYLASVVCAESFAVVVEALWLRRFGVRGAFAWSLGANAASLGLGLLSRALLGFP